MQEIQLRECIREAVCRARERKPLVPSLTNAVTVSLVANAQLAVGGSAAMFCLPNEGETMAQAGDAMYVNLGTMLPVHAETVPRTVRVLLETGTPWVLDPVGIGFGELRRELLLGFQQYRPSIVRGNASEMLALARLWGLDSGHSRGTHGIDSLDEVEDARGAAIAIARFLGGAVAVSGKVDLVTDGKQVAYLEGGSPLMERMTGAGCSLGGVCAVFLAVSDPFVAALAGTAMYNVAGMLAEREAKAPASFQATFLDNLYLMKEEEAAGCPMRLERAEEK